MIAIAESTSMYKKPLNVITLVQYQTDNINPMITISKFTVCIVYYTIHLLLLLYNLTQGISYLEGEIDRYVER
jgi:hypothetical protein